MKYEACYIYSYYDGPVVASLIVREPEGYGWEMFWATTDDVASDKRRFFVTPVRSAEGVWVDETDIDWSSAS